MIALENVKKYYHLGGETIRAVDGISYTFATGSFTSIVGPSGSGKSTFLHLIGGLEKPDSGIVRVFDERLDEKNDRALSAYRNRRIGFIFQTFNLQPHLTALENVALPLLFAKVPKQQRRARAMEAIELVSLKDRFEHRPSELSGGQRQRVAIARAIVNKPQILLADEPTGNLDSKSGRDIIELISDLNTKSGITIILVTHNEDDTKKSDTTLHIRDGQIQHTSQNLVKKAIRTIQESL